jgi:hypothetical protein
MLYAVVVPGMASNSLCERHRAVLIVYFVQEGCEGHVDAAPERRSWQRVVCRHELMQRLATAEIVS